VEETEREGKEWEGKGGRRETAWREMEGRTNPSLAKIQPLVPISIS